MPASHVVTAVTLTPRILFTDYAANSFYVYDPLFNVAGAWNKHPLWIILLCFIKAQLFGSVRNRP